MDAGLFWVLAGAMAVAVAGIIALAVLRGGRGAPAGPPGTADAAVYRDQLAEIARDLSRGVIPADEAERLRAEVARRLLEADRTARGSEASAARGPGSAGVVLSVALVAGGGLTGYLWLGAPGYPALPLAGRIATAEALRAARPAQAAAEALATLPDRPVPDAQFAALMAQLRARTAERPDDPEGQRLLAENEARLGNFAAAHAAQARWIALRGAQATAADQAFHARLMVAAAGGTVSAEAAAALARALAADPAEAEALFLNGLAEAQIGRPDLAFANWARYLDVAPPGHPFLPEVRGNIALVATAAGVRYTPPPERGPTAGDVAAAGALSADERAALVRSMVEGLAARLAEEGGPAEDWARLIGALGVLGETDRARAIWDEAQGRFAGREVDLSLLRTAAEAAGVAE
ncbi:MAG TPA: c-type cytochrome biogenesis protein CcmI [Paracoccaceae bacterium]|nr:c-type cytochrome biogenesis protein CcmI [Paracoccaceae bacterium]